MEDAQKIKKSRKKRHRSTDAQKIELSEEEKDLCKENHELSKTNSVIIDLNELQSKSQTVQTDSSYFQNSLGIKDLLSDKDEHIKSLTDRIQQITSKLYESKNAYTSLKQDFQKAQKLLSSEVGDNVSVAELSNQPGAWRGRAEQILQLQQKVSELQLKLSGTDSTGRKNLFERRSLSNIRAHDKEKKMQVESLTKELKESELALEGTKKKLEASKARKAVLENDLNTSKRAVALLNEKTTHDDQLIGALQAQLKTAEAKYQDREVETKRQNEKFEREIVLLKSELEAAHIHLQNFKRQVDDKNEELEHLRSNCSVIADRSVRSTSDNNAFSESPMSSPRSCTKDANEYIAIGIAAEAERERLLELVTVLNRRLDKERNDFEQLSENFRRERSRTAKLETKLQKLELERVGLPRVNTGSYRLKALKPTFSSSYDFGNTEDLRLKFELIQEECLTLKTRLATVQKDRSSDLATFKKMLEQTRKIFKDAYRGKLPTVGCKSSITV